VDATVCDGNTVNMSCGYINNYHGKKPHTYWKIIKRNSSGSVIKVMNVIALFYINNHDGPIWIRDKDNTENNRLLVGPVDETYNWTSYQCFISTVASPFTYSSVGTLTVAGEIFYYVCICAFILFNRLIT